MQSYENNTENQTEAPVVSAPQDGVKKKLLVALMCLTVLAVGVLVAAYLVRSQPKAGKRTPAKMKPLVSVMTVNPEPRTIVVQAMGTVVPAKELILKSRVAGEIVDLNEEFIEGGLLKNDNPHPRFEEYSP